MKKVISLIVIFVFIYSMSAFADSKPKPATSFTKETNSLLLKELPFSNKESFEDAHRGFVARPKEVIIRDKQGNPVWDLTKYSFIKEGNPAPDTVNPSLWRQSQLVLIAGLFKVTDRIYQVRIYDLSNMTIIEGDTGIIVVDPLVTAETAKAALDLYYENRPPKTIIAVIHSHSHIDHWGGVRGVVSEEEVKAGKVKIIAPEHFIEKAISENVMAGTAMTRRASYMYGNLLPPDAKGQVGAGLGVTTSTGTVTLLEPTDIIAKTGQKMEVDGLTFEFLLAPGTEAPAEMHWYIPELRALTVAENACHTLHNTYSLRGTAIRDPLAWANYLNESINMWGEKSDVLYGMHHWPVWGQKNLVEYLKKQRDLYKYINDQTLRLANHGYTMVEIAEMIELPAGLKTDWFARGYYGTLNHDVKSTYVKYLGWFDGNPALLHPHPPVEASKKYVEYMGGAKRVIRNARKSYDKGDYRWVVQVMNHVVFADPENKEARELQADALEQLGYQAESGPWRNFYLTGAQELREGVKQLPSPSSAGIVMQMPMYMVFDFLAISLNGPKAGGKKITLNWNFTDTNKQYVLYLENSAINYFVDKQDPTADATISLTRDTLNKLLLEETTFEAEIESGNIKIEGNQEKLGELMQLLDKFTVWFNIVTP